MYTKIQRQICKQRVHGIDREREIWRGGEEGEEAEGAKIKRGREHTNKRGKILASKIRCESVSSL